MNWRTPAAAMFFAIALTGGAFAQSSAPTSDSTSLGLIGEWKGQCDRCAAHGFTLVLSQDSSGTIKTEGTPTFGDSVKPIQNVKLSGNKLNFQAKGDAGDIFTVALTASGDGKTLNGNGCYRGGCFGLRFTRASP